jgi:hypothetical protein
MPQLGSKRFAYTEKGKTAYRRAKNKQERRAKKKSRR